MQIASGFKIYTFPDGRASRLPYGVYTSEGTCGEYVAGFFKTYEQAQQHAGPYDVIVLGTVGCGNMFSHPNLA